jgi:hypothetical protein
MKRFTLACLALAALLCAPAAHAALLTPNSVQLPAASEPNPGGLLLASTTLPFASPGAFSGTLTSSVYSGDPTNSLGGLTFTYSLVNDAVSTNNIARLSTTDFTGFATDASYNAGTSIAPGLIDRNLSGSAVGFSFFPSPLDPFANFLLPGATSSLLVVQTDAQFYVPTTAFVIDGGIASVATFGPSLVPEPATFALAAAGLLAVVATRRRR